MKRVASRIKPKSGFSYFIHLFITALIPSLVYVFVRVDLVPLALLIILLGKWRVFAVKPRHWWPYLRANAVDMLVGLSTLAFMTHSSSAGLQALFAVLYAGWLLFIKPGRSTLLVSIQALFAQVLGLTALFLLFDDVALGVLVVGAGVISYVCARHFLANFDEVHAPFFAHAWGYCSAALAWVMGHWLVYYFGVFAQPALLSTIFAFSIGSLYYLEQKDKLSKGLQRQIVFLLIVTTVVVIVFSDWGDKAI